LHEQKIQEKLNSTVGILYSMWYLHISITTCWITTGVAQFNNWTAGWTTGIRFPAEAGIFLFATTSRPTLGGGGVATTQLYLYPLLWKW